jgi:hypothetical protein
MNKRGFLLGEQTLKIIVAVICILLLLGLLFSLYSSYVGDKKLEQARESLDKIQDALDEAKDNRESNLMLSTPNDPIQGWFISSFNSEDSENFNDLPERCSQEVGGCVCICKVVLHKTLNMLEKKKDYSKYCNYEGVCADYKNVEVTFKERDIKEYRNIIMIRQPFTWLKITKEGDKLKIIKEIK